MTTPPQPPDSVGDTRGGGPGDEAGTDAEATRTMSADPPRGFDADAEATVQIPPVAGPPGPDGPEDAGGGRGRRRALVAGAAVVGLLAVLYVGDLLISATSVPRGVTVAGVEIGGMNRAAASEALRTELGPRVARPITLVAGSAPGAATSTLDPRAAGLDLDVDATIAQAGEQPLNPVTRLTSLFGDREVPPISKGNPVAVGQACVVGDGRNATLSPTEIGSFLRFDPDGSGGLTPRVDVPVAEKVVDRDLASTEAEPKDASFEFAGAAATVVPAVTGRTIDYPKTFEGLVEALGRAGDPAPPTTFTPPPTPPGATPVAPPDRGIGGGISQFSTTLYNATYFAGLAAIEHKEHSYYISRYPAGREATVFEGAIDLKFRNDGETPVLIRTVWTPSSIKVQLYGQKRFDVTSQTGPRTNPVAPGTRDLSGNPRCKPSKGVGGFTITDTRVLKDVRTGETSTEPRTVRYNAEPEITCGGG